LIHALSLGAHVDGCRYSAAIGYRKPMPAFFDAVAAKVGLPSRELLLIEDAEENVRAATEARWRVARWTGGERLSDLVARTNRTWHRTLP
jgi:putative hydrolase of the HAD superfamily